MNDTEQEKLAELIAIKVAEKYVIIMEKHVKTQIELHAAQCKAGKYSKVFCAVLGFLGAVVGGCFVALFGWLLKK
jgi:hypothetical protein